MNFNTLHIFNFGKVQLIGENYNKTVDVSELTKLESFVNSFLSQKPEDIENEEYHVIHVFNNLKGKFISKSEGEETVDQYSVEWSNLNLSSLTALVNEILAIEE